MTSAPSISALRVANEAFLVASTIDRCPKTMMLRELVMNALEAASEAPAGGRSVKIGSTLIDGVAKLRIWNTGPGLDPAELSRMCDLSSSLHKEQSLDRNFGMGAKVASLPSNRHGLRYRSCRLGSVGQVVLGQRDGIYGRLPQPGADAGGVADVTEICRGDPQYDLTADWTEVVLYGNRPDQDTSLDPYAGNPASPPRWVEQVLSRRFYRLPGSAGLTISAPDSPDQVFVPLPQRRGPQARADSVTTPSGIIVHYEYDPAETPAAASGQGGIAGVILRDELYAVREGLAWVMEAPSFGIPFGARHCAVFVELPDGFGARPEVYRQFLRFSEGDQRQVMLLDFAAVVRTAMPAWLKDVIASYGPPAADYLGEVRGELQGLLVQLGITAARRDNPNVRGTTPAAETPAPPKQPAEPKPPAKPRFEQPPEIISLREDAAIDERGLQARAARYYPDSHQLFVNLTYSAISRMAAQLCSEFESAADPGRISAVAAELSEWAVTRKVARALVYTLGKRSAGWAAAEVTRAQSPEALSVVADDYAVLLRDARRRLAEQLGIEPPAAEADAPLPANAAWAQRIAGELADAQQSARRALATPSVNAAPILRRVSDIEARRGNMPGALDWARQAVASAPDDPAMHNHLGALLLRTGDADAAEAAVQRAIAAAGARPAPYLRQLAYVAQHRGDLPRALEIVRQAIATAPAEHASHGLAATLMEQAGDPDAAEASLLQAIGLADEPSRYYRQLSTLALKHGRMEQALTWATRAIESDDQDSGAFQQLSVVMLRQGDLHGAAQAARRALSLSDGNPAYLLRQLSSVAVHKKDGAVAKDYAQQAVEAQPDDAWLRLHLGNVLLQQGDLDGAEREIRHALDLRPRQPSRFLRAMSQIQLRRHAMDAALASARQAVDADPSDVQSLTHLSALLVQMGDLAGAEEAMATAVTLDPANNSRYLRQLSSIAVQRSNMPKALDYAEESVAAAGADIWAFDHLAGLLMSAGKLERAAEVAKHALELPGVDRLPVRSRLETLLARRPVTAGGG